MSAATADDILTALAAATPTLDPAGQAIAIATYRTLAQGKPASVDAIAAAAGLPPERVTATLHDWPGVFRDAKDSVVGFWGLAIPPMPHHLTVNGVSMHTWCAWDPFFIAPVLAPTLGGSRVETTDPVTGETITYGVGPQGITGLSHPDSKVSFLIPDGPWGDDVQTTFCHFVLHFTGADSGERWVAEHPGTFLLDVDEAMTLGRRHARERFGAS